VLSFWKGNGASILQKMAVTGSNYVFYEKIKLALKPIWRSERDVRRAGARAGPGRGWATRVSECGSA
jgi:hypothetical protein